MKPKAASSILIIEDDDVIRESITELMEDEGYDVAAVENGKVGIDYLSATQRLPDLILLDLMMPVMDGFAFCVTKANQPSWSQIPTLVMSADGHVTQKREQTGAQDYIKKPLDILDLISRVKCFLP